MGSTYLGAQLPVEFPSGLAGDFTWKICAADTHFC
jgi:hypothetical protein